MDKPVVSFGTWQPIETAPKRSDDDPPEEVMMSFDVLVTDGRSVAVAVWWDRWVMYADMIQDPELYFEPTHWMPLPALPSGEGGTMPMHIEERKLEVLEKIAQKLHVISVRMGDSAVDAY